MVVLLAWWITAPCAGRGLTSVLYFTWELKVAPLQSLLCMCWMSLSGLLCLPSVCVCVRVCVQAPQWSSECTGAQLCPVTHTLLRSLWDAAYYSFILIPHPVFSPDTPQGPSVTTKDPLKLKVTDAGGATCHTALTHTAASHLFVFLRWMTCCTGNVLHVML